MVERGTTLARLSRPGFLGIAMDPCHSGHHCIPIRRKRFYSRCLGRAFRPTTRHDDLDQPGYRGSRAISASIPLHSDCSRLVLAGVTESFALLDAGNQSGRMAWLSTDCQFSREPIVLVSVRTERLFGLLQCQYQPRMFARIFALRAYAPRNSSASLTGRCGHMVRHSISAR